MRGEVTSKEEEERRECKQGKGNEGEVTSKEEEERRECIHQRENRVNVLRMEEITFFLRKEKEGRSF